jgi:hypothetical protein
MDGYKGNNDIVDKLGYAYDSAERHGGDGVLSYGELLGLIRESRMEIVFLRKPNQTETRGTWMPKIARSIFDFFKGYGLGLLVAAVVVFAVVGIRYEILVGSRNTAMKECTYGRVARGEDSDKAFDICLAWDKWESAHDAQNWK